MGKARILQALGEGRYTIEIIEARERAESAKQQAEARIQTLSAEVNQLDAKIQTAQQAADQAVTEQNAAIEQYQQEMAEEGSSTINLAEAAEKVMAAAGERDALRAEKRSKELRITADQALVARINSLPPLRQMQAWCADYTDDLSGEVATAEVPGEIGSVIIKPGFEGANQWSATTDGAMQPALAGTPASVFYNLAMLPGWQRWRPTYRVATITSIDGDTCSIVLDDANSSQQGLNVNAQSSYVGAPILYMDCNGAAFEQGDRVLVAFAGNVEGPTVVGFESEPKVCCQPELLGRHLSTSEAWRVREEFGNVDIQGGPASEWRIVDENSGEVRHSGGVNAVNGAYRLDGLPEEVDREIREVVSSVTIVEDSSKAVGEHIGTLQSPTRPDFAGGAWELVDYYQNVWGVGGIDESGNVISDFDPVISGFDIVYPGGEGWGTMISTMTYIKTSGPLLLEKGCNGEWPEVV